MIDLRSDTVTQPCARMRQAMAEAEVGDDVYGEDPTVTKLERRTAELTGLAAGLFFPSGTQSNLAALMAHCQRGDEYVVGQTAHTYRYEAGGGAVLGSIQPQPIEFLDDGTLDLDKVAAVIKPDDFHFARTRLLALENTVRGQVLPLEYTARARALADVHGLATHLDGARVCNAAVALGVPVSRVVQGFDSVSVCLSKGLGAPVGSVLCGAEDFIARARRVRKMLGGGMRQAGVLAAAGLVAIDSNIDRLAEDHEHAALLAEHLAAADGVFVHAQRAFTNMVFLEGAREILDAVVDYSLEHGVQLSRGQPIRLVTHKDISRADVVAAAEVICRGAQSAST